MSLRQDGSAFRQRKSSMNLKSLFPASRSSKQKGCSFQLEVELKFGLYCSLIYQSTPLKGKQTIFSGYLNRFLDCILYQLYNMVYLDPLIDSCRKRGRGKPSKKKKVVLIIPSNISEKGIAKDIKLILLISYSASRENVKV